MINELGFSKFYKPITSKIIFVKASNKFNNVELKQRHVVNHPKNAYFKNNSYVSKDKKFFKPACFYCYTEGHNLNSRYIRNFGIPYGGLLDEGNDLEGGE